MSSEKTFAYPSLKGTGIASQPHDDTRGQHRQRGKAGRGSNVPGVWRRAPQNHSAAGGYSPNQHADPQEMKHRPTGNLPQLNTIESKIRVHVPLVLVETGRQCPTLRLLPLRLCAFA